MKLLIVEDTQKHITDARKFFAEHHIDIVVARTLSEANQELNVVKQAAEGAFDGVISDIYFPHTDEAPWNIEIPGGLAVFMYCREKGIPVVLNTAGYHHGAKYEWINGLMRRLGLPDIIDAGSDYHKDADEKDWPNAWVALQKQFKK